MHKRFLQYLCGKSCPLRFFADRPAIPPATLGLPKIDAADQRRQLFLRERNLGLSFTRNRPAVTPFLKRFRTYPNPCAVPIDQLQPISLCVGKQKQMPTERVTLQLIAHQTVEAIGALAHVSRSRRQIDARGSAHSEHHYILSSTATIWASVEASKPMPTSILRPPGRSAARAFRPPAASGLQTPPPPAQHRPYPLHPRRRHASSIPPQRA